MHFPLRLLPKHTSIDFISKRRYAFVFSSILTIAVLLLVILKGVNFGIDFAGGVVIEIECNEVVKVDRLRKILNDNQYRNFNIQDFHKNDKRRIMLRLRPTRDSEIATQVDSGQEISNIKNLLTKELKQDNQEIAFTKIEYVGPKVGKDFILNAILAMIIALTIMMIYTWIRFDLIYGLGVIIALFHDAMATLGMYCITGYEFDLSSIAAILTVIGYSINDSVVIYDRIRENTNKYRGKNFDYIINISINETLTRSIMTLSTTLLVCLVLVLFGGDVLHGFSMAILFGIGFGAYSSIYISAPVLMLFHNTKLPKFIKNLA